MPEGRGFLAAISMKITLEFTCSACGLLTPTTAEIPDGVDERRPLALHEECHHCGNPMMVEFTSIKALKEAVVGVELTNRPVLVKERKRVKP